MNRRSFCQLSGAAALSSPVRSAEPASSGFKLNYLVSSAMYGTTPLAEVLPEIAKTMGVSRPTIEKEWRRARAWLASELS